MRKASISRIGRLLARNSRMSAGAWCAVTCRSVAAVEPERPGLYRADPQQPGHRPRVLGQARLDLVLVGGLDDMQRPVARAERAADDDEAVLDQPVHERSVLIPRLLGPDLPG